MEYANFGERKCNFEGRKWKNLSNPHEITEKRQRKIPHSTGEGGRFYLLTMYGQFALYKDGTCSSSTALSNSAIRLVYSLVLIVVFYDINSNRVLFVTCVSVLIVKIGYRICCSRRNASINPFGYVL